jgi:hypothetical protein
MEKWKIRPGSRDPVEDRVPGRLFVTPKSPGLAIEKYLERPGFFSDLRHNFDFLWFAMIKYFVLLI